MLTAKGNEEGRQMREAALHTAKYLFPLQYGLHNVFTSVLNYWDNAGRLREYGSREAEIQVFNLHSNQGPRKTPARLKRVLPLIESLIRRHRRFNYQRACAGICRSRVSCCGSNRLLRTELAQG
ncbi:hypothetical protein BDV93DRAFT_435833 [Ceratobasidium sp. AG-I]|nr:hypothetical protein BDV93DRAFT_435833 [Ceratobasidium sp. AG-I]